MLKIYEEYGVSAFFSKVNQFIWEYDRQILMSKIKKVKLHIAHGIPPL